MRRVRQTVEETESVKAPRNLVDLWHYEERRNSNESHFPWEEKLVAPLIATPNGQCATKEEDRPRKAKKLDYGLRE